MEKEEYKIILEKLVEIRNLLILNVSKAGSTSKEISNVINTSDSGVRQILTGATKKKKSDNSSDEK